jgi:hypothetical protein
MAGLRIAGFLTDNDSNACQGVLRESPKFRPVKTSPGVANLRRCIRG